MVDSFTLAKKKLYTLLHTKDYMSDTPRTDALMSDMNEGWPDRWAKSHAQLERELDEAQEEAERYRWLRENNFQEPEPKPDVEELYYASIYSVSPAVHFNRIPNLKLTFDVETCELKSAEVLK